MSSLYDNADSRTPPPQLQANLASVQLKYVSLPAPLPALDGTPVSLTASGGMRPPCHCLLGASPGEVLNLIAYDSFPADSITPYRGTGPVFVHAHNCSPTDGDVLPERQLRKLLSVRAYDEKHMVSAEVVERSELEGRWGDVNR